MPLARGRGRNITSSKSHLTPIVERFIGIERALEVVLAQERVERSNRPLPFGVVDHREGFERSDQTHDLESHRQLPQLEGASRSLRLHV